MRTPVTSECCRRSLRRSFSIGTFTAFLRNRRDSAPPHASPHSRSAHRRGYAVHGEPRPDGPFHTLAKLDRIYARIVRSVPQGPERSATAREGCWRQARGAPRVLTAAPARMPGPRGALVTQFGRLRLARKFVGCRDDGFGHGGLGRRMTCAVDDSELPGQPGAGQLPRSRPRSHRRPATIQCAAGLPLIERDDPIDVGIKETAQPRGTSGTGSPKQHDRRFASRVATGLPIDGVAVAIP